MAVALGTFHLGLMPRLEAWVIAVSFPGFFLTHKLWERDKPFWDLSNRGLERVEWLLSYADGKAWLTDGELWVARGDDEAVLTITAGDREAGVLGLPPAHLHDD